MTYRMNSRGAVGAAVAVLVLLFGAMAPLEASVVTLNAANSSIAPEAVVENGLAGVDFSVVYLDLANLLPESPSQVAAGSTEGPAAVEAQAMAMNSGAYLLLEWADASGTADYETIEAPGGRTGMIQETLELPGGAGTESFVPEPATWWTTGAAAAILGWRRRRRG